MGKVKKYSTEAIAKVIELQEKQDIPLPVQTIRTSYSTEALPTNNDKLHVSLDMEGYSGYDCTQPSETFITASSINDVPDGWELQKVTEGGYLFSKKVKDL